MGQSKLIVTFVLRGSTLMSKKQSGNNPSNYNHFRVPTSYKDEKGVLRHEVISISTRKTIPAKKVIKMNRDAFDNMLYTSVPNLKKSWGSLSKDEKIKAHIATIADDFNAISFSYKILDD